MNDPHVERIRCRIVLDDSVDYDGAPDVVEETPEFQMLVSGDTALFEMRKHFSSISEARAIVEEYLRRWEVLVGLECGLDELTFSYRDADVIDRAPSLGNKGVVAFAAVMMARTLGIGVKLHVSRNRYPSRPSRFSRSPNVEKMYHRYGKFMRGQEPLTSMAYFCLTVTEKSAGGQQKAAELYQIHRDVLRKLGELSSTRGSPLDVRKAPKRGNYLPLTPKARQWILEAVKALIRRLGEWAYDPEGTLDRLTMDDFPELDQGALTESGGA